jgi:hypothetical protein
MGEIMIINIENIENIEKMIDDLCNILDITPKLLKDTILTFANECIEGIMYHEDRFIELAEEFVKNNQKIHINEIYVCHLTRHIGEPKELLPLKELLTGKNKLTHFLEKNGVTFSKKISCISMSYKGKEIDIKDLYDDDTCENEHVRLAGRLGCCGEADYCVNGYTFAIEPEESMDWRCQGFVDTKLREFYEFCFSNSDGEIYPNEECILLVL